MPRIGEFALPQIALQFFRLFSEVFDVPGSAIQEIGALFRHRFDLWIQTDSLPVIPEATVRVTARNFNPFLPGNFKANGFLIYEAVSMSASEMRVKTCHVMLWN
jgi:hypothetical protein